MSVTTETKQTPTERFSNRVENYIKYRPKYPAAVIDYLRSELSLTPASIIADIGSGTGILSQMFLANGNTVYGVEPNGAMRAAGEILLRIYPDFRSVNGTAEATTLENESVDFVIAGQSFHWFDVHQARKEFWRILRPRSWAVLLWNDRKIDATSFLKAYENLLLEFGTDYEQVVHRNVDEEVLRQFFNSPFEVKVFSNEQDFDYDGLKGRLLSSSYAPLEGHPQYAPMIDALRKIFFEHQTNGQVRFEYDTRVYYGHIEL